MKCPCIKCTRREIGCHNSCDGYREWKRERKAANARRGAEMDVLDYIIRTAIAKKRGNKR